MNARFWDYVNGGYVKITLIPGQELTWTTGKVRNCEGWSRETRVYGHGTQRDEHVSLDCIDDGRDCDGSLSRMYRTHCPMTDLRTGVDGFGHEVPAWADGEREQRDQYAEMAGY